MNKVYSIGTKVFCDFPFGGKPNGIVTEIIEPGDGKNMGVGQVKVTVSNNDGAYRKGEVLILATWQAVPKAQEIKLKKGQFLRRINTRFEYK